MNRILIRTDLLLPLAVVALVTTAGTAYASNPPPADTGSPSPPPAAESGPGGPATARVPLTQALVLAIAQGPAVMPTRAVVLQCAPRGGGTHPRTRGACAILGTVAGDLRKLKRSPDMVCTLIFQPVTVSSVGVWNDHFVMSVRTFGNDCEMRTTLKDAATF